MVNGGSVTGIPTDSSFNNGDFNVAQFDSQEQRVQIIFNNQGIPFSRVNDHSRQQVGYENAWSEWVRIDAGAVNWNNLPGKPSTFPPSSHNHTKSQITDFAHTHDDRYFTEIEVNAKFNAKHLEIVGKDYGGILNTAGAKTAGKTYFDNNTKKLFLCKNNNSDTSANVANYIALDNNSLLDRLENLFNINNTIFSATMNGFKTVKSSVIKNKTLSIKSINSVDKSSTIYNATLTITGNHTVDVCNGEHKLSFQEQNGEYLIRFYRVNDNFWVYCDNSVVVYL